MSSLTDDDDHHVSLPQEQSHSHISMATPFDTSDN